MQITEMINDAIISGVTKIANHERIVKELEPNVFSHETIKEHQVKRILYSYFLLLNEWRNNDNTE